MCHEDGPPLPVDQLLCGPLKPHQLPPLPVLCPVWLRPRRGGELQLPVPPAQLPLHLPPALPRPQHGLDHFCRHWNQLWGGDGNRGPDPILDSGTYRMYICTCVGVVVLYVFTRKMVPIPRRVSSCLALALSILLSSLAHHSSSLSCVFFSSSQALILTYVTPYLTKVTNALSVSRGLLFLTTCSFPLVVFWFSFLLYLFCVLSSAFLSSVLQSLKLCLL